MIRYCTLVLARRLLLVVLCWFAFASMASAAPSSIKTPLRIVAFRSIAGVPLGMSVSRVRRLLGKPSLVQYATGHRITEFGYTKKIGRYDQNLFIFFNKFGGGVVTSIQDGLPAQTAHGAGTGSSRAVIERAFGHLRCSRVYCDATSRRRTMSFAFEHGKVDLIELGSAIPSR